MDVANVQEIQITEGTVQLPANYNLTPASIVPRADSISKILYGIERIALLNLQNSDWKNAEKAYSEFHEARIVYGDIAREWSNATPTQRKELALTAYHQSTDITQIMIGPSIDRQLAKLEEDLMNAAGVTPEDIGEVLEAIKIPAEQAKQKMDW